MAVVTMRQLLENGVHFGHQTRRWNPKMKRFIMTERNGIYIIDLQQSLSYLNEAYDFVKETVAHGGTILFVGTKKQAQESIAEQAQRVGMPFVNHRWLGGMLTNFNTVSKRLSRLKELEEIDFDDVAGSGRTKKELLMMRREMVKLERTLGGIRDMARVPSAVWVVDTKKEHLAVTEARKLGVPVIAILDTNCDPDEVDYKIPGNDDAIRAVTLLTRVVADAVADGLMSRASGGASAEDGTGEAVEPMAEWERELLAGSDTEQVPAPAAASEAAPAQDAAVQTEPAQPAETETAEVVAEATGTEPEVVAKATPEAEAEPDAPAATEETSDSETASVADEISEPEAVEPAPVAPEAVVTEPEDIEPHTAETDTEANEPEPAAPDTEVTEQAEPVQQS